MRRHTAAQFARRPFLYNFGFGSGGAGNQTIPYLDGTEVAVHWSDIQPGGPTDFQDGVIWSAVANWLAVGKKVIIRVHTGQIISGGNSNPISTPNWVFNPPYNARYVWDGSTTQSQQNQAPVRWDAGFLAAYHNFIQLLAARYDGMPGLYAIQMGIGSNGESKAGSGLNTANELALWTNGPFWTGNNSGPGTGTSVPAAQVTPWSNAVWWSTVQTIIGYYVAAFKHTPLIAMINDSSFSPVVGTYDITGMFNSVYGWYPQVWAQNNGLTAWQTINPASRQYSWFAQEPVHSSTTAGVGTLQQLIQQAVLNSCQVLYWFGSDITLDAGNGYPMLQYAASLRGT